MINKILNKSILNYFYILFFLTLLNAMFNSLASAYGIGYPFNTFLCIPQDLHADLIKFALSFGNISDYDYSTWNELYKNFLLHNPHGKIEALHSNNLAHFVAPPLSAAAYLLLAKILTFINPSVLVFLFYLITFSLFFLLLGYFIKFKSKDFFRVYTVIMLSYPILVVLTRGHLYSLTMGILSILFIFKIFNNEKYIYVLPLLLAIMINIRPNSIFLMLLFLVFGFKKSIKLSMISILLAGIIFVSFLNIVNYLYSDYTFLNFLKGVKIYFDIYVLGLAGHGYNNSLLGLFTIPVMSFCKGSAYQIFSFLNPVILITGILLSITSCWLYYKKRIESYTFLFLIISIYVLCSTIFTTYYMVVLFVFLLIPMKKSEYKKTRHFKIITLTSTLLLAPKNYIFFQGFSLEIFINPLLMLSVMLYILYYSLTNKLTQKKTSVTKSTF